MALKILDQRAPGAATLEDLYTVPSGKEAAASSIVICNRGGTGVTFRLAACPGGAAIADPHWLAYDIALPANSTYTWVIGVTLATGDVVRCQASAGTVSFTMFGEER